MSFKNDFSQNYATNHGGGVYVSPNAAIGHLSVVLRFSFVSFLFILFLSSPLHPVIFSF